jgi:AcrR family transcriptional regulator
VRYHREVTDSTFRRARSAENKQRRADALVEAARSLAWEGGVVSVTLTAVAERAGVHHSAVRRYFSSHKDVLLLLAEEGWTRWSATVRETLSAQRKPTPERVAGALAAGLAADPLFCDLLAHVPLHLEHDVETERVAEFKRGSHTAVTALAEAVGKALPGLRDRGALDLIIAADALAATLWQMAHPPRALAETYAAEPEIARTAVIEFEPTLTRLLTATCRGLLPG